MVIKKYRAVKKDGSFALLLVYKLTALSRVRGLHRLPQQGPGNL